MLDLYPGVHLEEEVLPLAREKPLDRPCTLVADRARRFEVKLLVPEAGHRELAIRRRERGAAAHHAAGRDAVVSPMQGTVLAVEVEEGDEVSAGQVLCIVEAMKMENEITAHREGTVMELSVSPGASVTTGQVLCVIVQDDG